MHEQTAVLRLPLEGADLRANWGLAPIAAENSEPQWSDSPAAAAGAGAIIREVGGCRRGVIAGCPVQSTGAPQSMARNASRSPERTKV